MPVSIVFVLSKKGFFFETSKVWHKFKIVRVMMNEFLTRAWEQWLWPQRELFSFCLCFLMCSSLIFGFEVLGSDMAWCLCSAMSLKTQVHLSMANGSAQEDQYMIISRKHYKKVCSYSNGSQLQFPYQFPNCCKILF